LIKSRLTLRIRIKKKIRKTNYPKGNMILLSLLRQNITAWKTCIFQGIEQYVKKVD